MAQPPYTIPYDPFFLGDGFEVPVPSLTNRAADEAYEGGVLIDYIHYSLSMNASRRVAAFTAHNIDAERLVKMGRSGIPWTLDERVPSDFQLGKSVYADNAWDRGHLVRREDVVWGTVPRAREANRATFYYTNAAPQHENFNQDEWLGLEDWVLHKAPEFSYRLSVFTGPVLDDSDRPLSAGDPELRRGFRAWKDDVLIPAAFWKVVVLRDASVSGDDLSVVAFAMRQTDLWNDKQGKQLLHLKVHQVTLQQIEEWTALDFGPLKAADELGWSDSFDRKRSTEVGSPYPVINAPDDIVYAGDVRRARGGRMERSIGRASTRERSKSIDNDCGCDRSSSASTAAVAELSSQLAGLVDMISGVDGRSVQGEGRERNAAGSESSPGGVAAGDWEKVRNAFGSTRKNGDEPSHIVGGKLAYQGQFESCVCLGSADDWFCTGALVHPRVILSAAHCGSNISRILVNGTRIPTSNGATDGRIVPVVLSRTHPQYSKWRKRRDDIAIVVLADDAGLPHIALASDAELAAAAEVVLAGFGAADTAARVGFGTLRHVRVALGPVKTGSEDHSSLEQALGYDAATEIVAGRKGLGQDSCNGDSGGPLYIATDSGLKLAGLTSRATREATRPCGDGGIYVRPLKYLDWIQEMVKPFGIEIDKP